MKKTSKRFFRIKYIIALAIIISIAAAYAFTRKSSVPVFESSQAMVGDVVETVSVTGKVSPVDKADLAFEKSGVATRIFVKVGDQVKKGDPIAYLDSAGDQADVASLQATLQDISRPLRSQEQSVEQAKVDSAATALGNAQKDALNAVSSAFNASEGALVNHADAFFTNPQSGNPTIKFGNQSYDLQLSINLKRADISIAFNAWGAELAAASGTADVSDMLSHAQTRLGDIQVFLNSLSAMVNALNPGNSGLSQASIDSYTFAMNSALSELNGAQTSVTGAQTELRNASSAYVEAQNEFNLKEVGSSAQSIAAQSAKVDGANAELAKDRILSPIDGVITFVEPNEGEFVSAGETAFTVQSDGAYKIEAYVPEADVAKVALGDLASTTLDAYGSNIDFPSQVTAIDPAETILEGVPTYKVTLLFVASDVRIRSGMTANLVILTHKASGVLEIPYRATIITATSTAVRKVSADGKAYAIIPVVAGLKGSDGSIQIISGLNAGDKVVTYVK